MRHARIHACVVACALSSAVQAAEDIIKLEEFKVTAQKRVETLFEVPAAIAAYSGTFLERAGVNSFDDLAAIVPGLVVREQSPNLPGINLRGITTDTGDPRLAPRIAIFQDGVDISRSRASVVEMFDLERVEVLKGPQGTLFGRGAEIGAIAIVQNRAKDETSGRITVGFGDHHERRTSGHLNLPLLNERLFGRIAFTHQRYDGMIENLVDGSRLNGKEMNAVRGALRWLPNPSTTVDLIANWQRDTPPGTAFKSGVIPTSRGDTSPFTAAELTRGAKLGIDRTVDGATLIIAHSFDKHWSITGTTAFREYDSYERSDADGSGIYLIELDEQNNGRQYSQEFRLNYDPSGRFTGFAGLSFLYEKGFAKVPNLSDERALWPFLSGFFRSSLLTSLAPLGAQGVALVNAAVPAMNPFVPQDRLPAGFSAFAALPAPLNALAALANAPLQPRREDDSGYYSRIRAADLFVDGTYRATPRLAFTGGLRLTRTEADSGWEAYNRSVQTLGFIVNNIPGYPYLATNGIRRASATSTAWDGRAIARYEYSRTLAAYASVSRGHRPACLVLDATTQTMIPEEIVVNYEVGLKGTLRDGRLQWSAAAYRYLYTHFQTRVLSLGKFSFDDAGNATGKGVELGVQGRLSNTINLFANYAFTDATFDHTDGRGAAQQLAGFTFRLTPRNTWSAGGTIEIPLATAGQIFITPTWSYKSRTYFDDNNSLFGYTLRQDGHGLVNLRIGWRAPQNEWEISAHADNLFDKQYIVNAGNIGGSFGVPTFIPGSPRRLVAQVTRFW